MYLNQLKPRKALNKAFLKVKPNRDEIEHFKANLIRLLDRINDTESEEFHKNLVIDFLKKTYYDPNHFINTKGRNDLVIHNGDKAKSSVGVILETKKPTNRAEMPQPIGSTGVGAGENGQHTTEKLNVKAFHELMLYYLRERITHKNLEVKHLVITNINEWFIFDATVFDRLFAQDKALVKRFEDFEAGRLADTKTEFFYTQIARPFLADLQSDLEYTYFDLRDYRRPLRNDDKADDNKLIALFKMLSPEHLLKLPFANDSNSLDRRFYSELLHIIGLKETKERGKKLIGRNAEGERNTGTILENAIIHLDSLDKINRLTRPGQFGSGYNERLFNVSMELSITWINRILFLKLLEAQLITYHKGDRSYAFLNLDKIRNYDDLNSLFFEVLARRQADRNEDVKKAFAKVPYLNSSLFEPTDLEQDTLMISNLRDDKAIPNLPQTVLRDRQGKRRTGNLNALEYLFDFLNAYDFSSVGSEEIQEDNKALINASVLGLIFEKINGYKDGSFFTPGFITMYMCRETIRKAVVRKFNETKGWKTKNLEELYDRIEDRDEANEIVNGLKICDPAVGSGHFLVSALNEMIAVKNDLKILQDRDGRRLKEYQVEVVNDELIVTDEEGELFDYNPNGKESQRVQEALFHEKQSLIENCLFGVDINPNSVKICRLRLWIELLKSAYYKNADELETLPNIDINIKCGNSLVSRFAIDADVKKALRKSKWSIDSYRAAVNTYRNAVNKEQKREMERLISDIKSDFRSEISLNDPKAKRLRKLSGELFQLTQQPQLFEMNKREKAAWNKRVAKLTKDTKKLAAEIEEIKANKIFENAFEWRFEFPEVLNEAGDFVGFDVVIGNPPYIRQEELGELKTYLAGNYQTYAGTADLYVYFVERALSVLKDGGAMSYIMPNKWMRAGYGRALRKFLSEKRIEKITDFGDLPIFEEAITYPCIVEIVKAPPREAFEAAEVQKLEYPDGRDFSHHVRYFDVLVGELREEGWNLVRAEVQKLLAKIRSQGVPLGEYVNGNIYRGVLTGLNEAFVIDRATRDRLISEDPRSAEVIKPFLAGRDVKRYEQPGSDKFLILFKSGDTKKWFGDLNEDEAHQKMKEAYPAIMAWLEPYEEKAKKRYDKGQYWWELRACDYYDEFEKGKILYPDIAKDMSFAWDSEGHYGANTVYMLVTDQKWLVGYLNSRLAQFYYRIISNSIRGGYMRFFSDVLKTLPVPEGEQTQIKRVALEVMDRSERNEKTDRVMFEAELDRAIYEAFQLTTEEVDLIQEFEKTSGEMGGQAK